MAISKHRKTHTAKVAERYTELVSMRLEAGMARTGEMPKPKLAKRKPYRNPDRINLTKSQKRQAKAARFAARELQF